ncbi:MAG: hypothetical protein Q9181_004374 [Wetmoreana brouardii]
MKTERQQPAMTGGSCKLLTADELGVLQALRKISAVSSATMQTGKENIEKMTQEMREQLEQSIQSPEIQRLQEDVRRLAREGHVHKQLIQPHGTSGNSEAKSTLQACLDALENNFGAWTLISQGQGKTEQEWAAQSKTYQIAGDLKN